MITSARRWGLNAEMASRPVAPSCWLAAPLAVDDGRVGEFVGDLAESAETLRIDEDLMSLAVRSAFTCRWPTVQALLARTDAHADAAAMAALAGLPPTSDGGGGGVALRSCALGRYKGSRHANLLTDVTLRGAHVWGANAHRHTGTEAQGRRVMGTDGRWATSATKEMAAPFDTDGVRVLPLRQADLAPLHGLRRLVWRLEHVALCAEIGPPWLPDAARRHVAAAAPVSDVHVSPSTLDVHVAAVTHKATRVDCARAEVMTDGTSGGKLADKIAEAPADDPLLTSQSHYEARSARP